MNFLEKEWAKIALISYTAWAFYVLAIITIAPTFIYSVIGIDTNPLVWGRLQIVVIAAGIIGRMVLQPTENRWRRRSIIAVAIAAICFVSLPALAHKIDEPNYDEVVFTLATTWEGENKEGEFHVSYFDTIAKPPLWTVCYGHTRTAGPGQYKTDEQCRALLVDELAEYRAGLHGYFSPETIANRLPVMRDAAYTSLAYNVGIGAAGKSTATRRLNRGDIIGGCEAITWWNKAGGRVVRGLVRRRSEEQKYCLDGTQ